MAFAVTNRYDVPVGGNLKISIANWSGAEGDATGTYTVPGGRVVGGIIYSQDTNGNVEHVRWQGVAGAVTGTVDVSIFNRMAVTTGTIILFYQ